MLKIHVVVLWVIIPGSLERGRGGTALIVCSVICTYVSPECWKSHAGYTLS